MRKVLFLKGLLTIIMLVGLVFPAMPVAMADGTTPADPVVTEGAPAEAPADVPLEVSPEGAPADAPAEQAPAEVSLADVPVEAAPVEVPVSDVVADAAAAQVTLANAEGKPLIAAAEDTVALLEEGDPYYTDPVSGIKYGWTFSGHSCAAGVSSSNCTKVSNPIQAAITAAPAGVTIYIENAPSGHNYTQDVSIDKKIALEKSGSGSLTFGGTVTLKSGADITNINVFANNVFVNGGSIQDGIDLVKTGGTVTLAPGSFSETVTISRDVNLKSTGTGATTEEFILNDGAMGSTDKVHAPNVEVNNGARIQFGVDLAVDGGNVSVAAGDYHQNVTFSKAVNITGLGGDVFANKFTLNTNINPTNISAHEVVVNNTGVSLQLGVDLAEDGGHVKAASGTFNEDVTIDKNIDLTSKDSHTTFANSFTLNSGASGSASSVFAPNVFVNSGASLQLGIDLAQADGTVTVNPGVYTESVKIERSLNLIAPEGATIDQSGSDNAVITLDSPEGFFDWSGGDQTNVFIQGFDLLGGTYGIKVSENFYGSLTVQDTTIAGSLATEDALHSKPPVDTAGIELQGGGWDLLKWLLTGDGWKAVDLTSLNLQNVTIQNFDNGINMDNDHINVDQLTILDSAIANNVQNGVNLAEGNVSGLDIENTNFYSNGENGLYIGNNVLNGHTDNRSLVDVEPTQPAFTLFGNQFTFNGMNGVLIDQGTGVSNGGVQPITVVMTLNRFFGNGLNGVSLGVGGEPENQGFWWQDDDNVKPPVAVSAADNWWGCNAGPNTPLCDSTSGPVSLKNEFGADAWLIYLMVADPQTINIGGETATITGPYMTGYGDLTYTQVDPPWFTPGDVSMDPPQLGTLAQTLTLALNNWKFTSGDTAGIQWFSAPPLDNESPKVSVEIVDPCVVNPTGPGCGSDQGDGNNGGTFGVFRERGTGGGVGGVIPVTGSGLLDMVCGTASRFALGDGDEIAFVSDLCGYQANLGIITGDELPAALPDGDTLVSGLNANLVKDGTALDAMPEGTQMIVSFVNPPAGAVVLFWDPNTNAWVEVASTLTADGRLEVITTTPGLYVMVTK